MDGASHRLGDIELHFWLTRSVARVLDVNLSEAMAAGRLSVEQYGDMITACRGAGCAGRCEEWLATQTGRPDCAPPYCVNAVQLGRLR